MVGGGRPNLSSVCVLVLVLVLVLVDDGDGWEEERISSKKREPVLDLDFLVFLLVLDCRLFLLGEVGVFLLVPKPPPPPPPPPPLPPPAAAKHAGRPR